MRATGPGRPTSAGPRTIRVGADGGASARNLVRGHAANQGVSPQASGHSDVSSAASRARSSAGERSPHTGEVVGSIPTAPISRVARARGTVYFTWAQLGQSVNRVER